MKMKFIKSAALAVVTAVSLSAMTVPTASAQQAKSLDELLNLVQRGKSAESRENSKREAEFKRAKSQQGAMLKKANQMRAAEEKRSSQLEAIFNQNEEKLKAAKVQLKERMGSLTEMFGHLTSASGDLRSTFTNSLVSAQFPDREAYLNELIEKLSAGEDLPSIEQLEKFWFELMREIKENGSVVEFQAEVGTADGEKSMQKVMRVGAFNIVSEDGKYLQYTEEGNLVELGRQPSGPFIGWAQDLANSTSGLHPFGVDPTGPSGGSYLSALINSPTLMERFHQGGYVGYAIAAVGVFGFLLAIWRLIVLAGVGSKVNSQLKNPEPNDNNPLGRVLAAYKANPNVDTETLELKMNEAVLKETPKIEAGLNLLKIIAAVAPLMGLLGTVTGMIITFQAITIFGAGDPQAMAGGISGALVTTVLGLLVAIPTVLLHTLLSGRAKKIIHTLDEQAAGIIADHNEAKRAA